ncbi:alpha/beta fold hydrolase [Paenibacillus sedimenti]|uniref:Alpha/beta hydrolase n=1 Tax=Paenibacillus sedimenti TaxID=2770274 RepID=A0A926QNI9_9BACL|nr:alpha/beta hydrolase [Paenibacillus sedimenti]MBD0384837.1 alpha/beta hydrolase [Paenibacillus sedimenti]
MNLILHHQPQANLTKKFMFTMLMAIIISSLGLTMPSRISAESAKQQAGEAMAKQSGYAEVNGLNMYYEIHGGENGGTPLVLLHGAFMNADSSFGQLLPQLAKTRTVIVIEQQGHGRTADIDRPLSYEQMADDTAALLAQLGFEKADFFGWSMGGVTAIQIAVRHPKIVGKVAVTGANFGPIESAFTKEGYNAFKNIPDDFAPPPLKDSYDKLSPKPEQWSAVVVKVREMGIAYQGVSTCELRKIQAPFMVMTGDHDTIDLNHLVDSHRQLQKGSLAIVPNGDHFLPLTRAPLVLRWLEDFLQS